jgi:hypothetical protein
MVLGDRDPHDSISKEFIYNQEANKFELKARENRDTIGKILDIIPEWKPYADKLLRENNDSESSLYYILWTIGRTVEKQSSGIPLQATRTEDLKGHFEMLIESDLRLIHSSYPGLAALLHYYACTYSAGRIFFSYDFFFDRLAGHFGVRPGYSPREALADSRVRPVLDIYVHQATGMLKSAGSTPLLAFNHDVLADEGLSRARIDGIDPFDDRVILKTLDIFMDHADNFSASGFLYYAMHNVSTKNFPNERRRSYIQRFFNRKYYGIYLAHFFKDASLFPAGERERIADEILSAPDLLDIMPMSIQEAMKNTKNQNLKREAARKILKPENLTRFHPNFLRTAFENCHDYQLQEEFIQTVLRHPDVIRLPGDLVAFGYKSCQDQDLIDEVAEQFLVDNDPLSLDAISVMASLQFSSYAVYKDYAAERIFEMEKVTPDKADLVVAALKHSSPDVQNKDLTIRRVLEVPDLAQGIPTLVENSFIFCRDEELIASASAMILSEEDVMQVKSPILIAALDRCQDSDLRNKVSEIILRTRDITDLNPHLVKAAYAGCLDEGLRHTAAMKILEGSTLSPNNQLAVTTALHQFEATDPAPDTVHRVVKAIIDGYHGPDRSAFYSFYHYLLGTPLHQVPAWKEECLRIIRKFRDEKVEFVMRVLWSFRSEPDTIKPVCRHILKNWRHEITRPIRQADRNTLHYTDHVKLALGHPGLRDEALAAAREIQADRHLKTDLHYQELIQIAANILNNDYPKWETEN